MYLACFGAACFVAGLFASSLTRSQVAAAMISFVLGVSCCDWIFGRGHPVAAHWQSQVLSYFACSSRCTTSPARGGHARGDFYVSLTFFFLFLTLRVVESALEIKCDRFPISTSFSPGRRWKIGFDVVVRTALVLAWS